MTLPNDPEFVQKIDEALDQFENDLAGLPKWTKQEAPKYLYVNIDELRKKTPDELSEAVVILNQYALNVQRLTNKLRAWERYCYSLLDTYEARHIPDIPPGYGFNERAKMARNNPEVCKRLNEFLRKTKMQLDRLDGVPNQVKIIADSIREMKFVALRREKSYAN